MTKRIMMSSMERNILNANIQLVKEQKVFKKDISILIAYIKGNTYLKSEVAAIIEAYTRKNPPCKYD